VGIQELEHYHIRSAELMRLIEGGKTELAEVKEQLRALQFQYTEYARQQPVLDPTLIQVSPLLLLTHLTFETSKLSLLTHHTKTAAHNRTQPSVLRAAHSELFDRISTLWYGDGHGRGSGLL